MNEQVAQPKRSGGVQSIERTFLILETLAQHDGVLGVSQLAQECDLPLPTIHRLLRTLLDLGYVRQEPNRQYALGPRLMRLGEMSSRTLSLWAQPHLNNLVDALGESANMAMLDGDQMVYVAQAQSRQSMRMFTEVGRRVLPHCTAVGKAVLATHDPAEVAALLRRTGMPRHTETTITDIGEFSSVLEQVVERGYAMDEGEQELGVRCVAVAVPAHPARLALSVSGPKTRMTDAAVERAVPLLASAAAELAVDLRTS